MSSNLQLVASRQLNGITFNCYVEHGQGDPQDFWATRTQIGELLGYADPSTAIKNIHSRNKDRLDKFSRVAQIELPFGGSQEVVLYNFKGLLEICRYSQQETANAVIDVLWDIADEIRRTGSYSAKEKLPASSFKVAEALIDKVFKCKTEADCQQVRTLDKVFQGVYGYSVLEVGEIQPEAKPDPEPTSHSTEIWVHIVSTFAPDEWFSMSELMETLDEVPVGIRQVRRYLLSFVASKQLKRRGSKKSTEYSIGNHPRP